MDIVASKLTLILYLILLIRAAHQSDNVLKLNKCPSGHAHIADNMDCHDFYHCTTVEHAGYAIMVRKSCGKFLMFDPFVQNCNWPYRVRQVRPECNYEVYSEPVLTRIYKWHPKGKNPLKDNENKFIAKISTNQSPIYPSPNALQVFANQRKASSRLSSSYRTTTTTLPPTTTTTSPPPPKIHKSISKLIPLGRFNLNSLRIFTPQNITKLREAHPKNLSNQKWTPPRRKKHNLIKLRIL